MPAVVDLHRHRVDVGFQGIGGIGQVRQGVSHDVLLEDDCLERCTVIYSRREGRQSRLWLIDQRSWMLTCRRGRLDSNRCLDNAWYPPEPYKRPACCPFCLSRSLPSPRSLKTSPAPSASPAWSPAGFAATRRPTFAASSR